MQQQSTVGEVSSGIQSSESIEDGEPFFVPVQITFSVRADVVESYIAGIKAIIAVLEIFEESDMCELLYELNPVLVAEGIFNDVTETLPIHFGFYRVKCVVEHGSLYILDLSIEPYQPTVVGSVCQQAGTFAQYETGSKLIALKESTSAYPGYPDVALVAAPRYTPPGSHVSPRIGIPNHCIFCLITIVSYFIAFLALYL